MFQMDSNLSKLKTNLKLALNRLKLLQKKKSELTQKARKEIADSIAAGKVERAKIRVEYIIREDYMVEALEIVEMYCDILLSRFGLIQQLKTLDPSIAEAVSSLLWVAPQLFTDVSEMKVISEQLTLKYGKKYTEACRLSAVDTISEKLKHKLNIQAPPKLLVEQYLIEISKTYNIPYTPDPQVMKEEEQSKGLDALLFDGIPNDLSDSKGYPRPPGFVGYPQPPPVPSDFQPFSYPVFPPQAPASAPVVPPPGPLSSSNYPPEVHVDPKAFSYNIPPSYSESTRTDNAAKPINTQPQPPYPNNPNINDSSTSADKNKQSNVLPKPAPRSKMAPSDNLLPELPAVPSDDVFADLDNNRNIANSSHPSDDNEIDFDDIARRFEELKRKQ